MGDNAEMGFALPLSQRMPTRQRFRLKLSRWLLLLVLFWQAMIVTMPLAQARAAAGDGAWETICTMQGSSQVWVSDHDADGEPHAQSGNRCPLCVMSHTGIAPPPVFDFTMHRVAGAEVGQLAFTAVYLTRAWSEPATGPPSQL